MKLPNDEIVHYKSNDGVTCIVERTELVRCKDCKWAEVHKKDSGVFCEYNECGFEKNDYCSYGERKDNEDK